MTMPFSLPDWLPWWAPIVVAVPVGLYLLVFLVMPFSVVGLKGRLDLIDARLDEIQGEIRMLSLRLPEPVAASDDRPATSGSAARSARPPVAPAPGADLRRLAPPSRQHEQPGYSRSSRNDDERGAGDDGGPRGGAPNRPVRAEPRLDWPR